MESEEHPALGKLHQTPPRGHSTPLTDPNRVLVPVLTRASSLPSTPVPSLEWDRSCLQEPFLGGQSDFLGIRRLEKRKPSATDPHLVVNDKVLLWSGIGAVSRNHSWEDNQTSWEFRGWRKGSPVPLACTALITASSSFNSSIVRLVESAGNISSTVMSTMDAEAEDLLEDDLLRLKAMKNDAEACLKLFMTWQWRNNAEWGADLKKQVEGEVTKLKADFKTYKLEMAAKKKALQPSRPPPPPAVSMPTSNDQAVLINHLQHLCMVMQQCGGDWPMTV